MSKQDNTSDMNRQDFIETEGSISRVKTVLEGIRSGNPLLLEGETGSSKTRTAIEASLRNNQTPIVINFSSQTTIEDLIGRITKDSTSYGFFSFTNGPYTNAFMNGDCLILDEINLAYENVLQCIQASLDSGKLYLEMSGSEKKFVEKHPNFHIIATQNPLKGRFSQKRQSFSQKFRSLFQTITFDEIKEDELKEIADGLAKDLIIDNKEEIIEKLIKFHFFWKEKAAKENQIHVFTIREIKRTIESMKNGLSPYESILINYGSRYDKIVLFEMQRILLSHEFGFVHEDSKLTVPVHDKKLFFMTKPIQRALSSSFHMLQTCHPILITGPDGCGKTSFARWLAQIYQQQQEITKENDEEQKEKNDNDDDNENKEKSDINDNKEKEKMTNFFICNPEVSISDIIGRYMPVKGSDGEAPIMWIDGPVVKSAKHGHCLILDQINTAPSTILERLNSLFDNLGIEDARFQVQENSEETSIPIHQNFRIIATSTIDGLNDISPALLNRFTIIHIDDQLAELIKNNQVNEFIKQIAPQFVQSNDINLISKAVIGDKNKMTVSKISMIVSGFSSLKKTFPRAISSQVLDFCLYATSNNMNIPPMDENFINLLLSSLNEDNNKDTTFDSFIYNKAEATKRIMAVLVAAFVAGYHIVLIGKTGLGKTSAAIALSRLSKFSKGRQFISFNGQTQLEELFGFFTIEKGNFTSHSGPLSDAMENGTIFIADELNLADQMIIQSLNVAIEPSRNEEIILPVIGKNITIDKHFFFIGCQNDISMYGRKQLPEAFKKKVLCINYPDNSYLDLLNLTSTLAEQFKLPKNCALGTTELIKLMKEDPTFKKKVWSLREVRKLFRRTQYIQSHPKMMSGFTIHTNAAFLLRSSFRDISGISKKVTEFVSKAFKLKNEERDRLLNDLETEVFVTQKNKESEVYLKKNQLLVIVKNSELLKIPKELQTFWQTFFEVMITHPSEPLLFVGPSGFKTFLAKAVCPLSPIVYLHSDTTISSLIGQISLLDKNQAKQYLLESLFNFAGSAPLDECCALFKEIREMETIDKEKIEQFKKFIINRSFESIVENVIQQLIDIDYSQNDATSAFSNYLSVFKLGVITKYVMTQNTLILKNIAQPSPTVLERLNELLSVTPTLTLFEDTSNTFTPPNEKIISQFLTSFRIIGICTNREKRGLSEAMLSRLTEIYVPPYAASDQELVINSIVQSEINDEKSINFYKNKLNKANEIFSKEKEKLKMSIPFTKIIEIVRTSISLHKFFTKYDRKESEESLFGLALLRFATENLSFDNKKKFIDIFYDENSEFSLYDGIKKLYDEDSIEGTTPKDFLLLDEDQDIIRSKLSNVFMPTPLNKLPETNIYFTPSLKDLADTIISCSAINYPLIIEGPNGSGKSSVFFYLSKCADANVVRISISSSTTVDDLFGKYEPNTSSEFLRFDFQPTNFLNAISSENFNSSNQDVSDDFSPLKKQWIIIEELHLASASVLDSLAPVFNNQTDKLLLPDGTVVSKRDYFIVGLVSQPLQSQSINHTSMIFKTPNYTESEYEQIYRNILTKNNFDDEICRQFSEKMFLLNEVSATSQYKIPVTVREAHKFINLFEGSEGKIEIDQILKMLCFGRFSNDDFVEEAKEKIKFNYDNDKLINISVDSGTSILSSNGIPMRINASLSTRHYDVQYLSSSEKELFVFLSMALKKYTPIVIQGPTSSGKTYSIQLFSDIVGKPLQIIQLNSEINSQTISGTFHPSKNLSESEMDELKDAIRSISNLPNLTPEFVNKIENEDISNWHPSDFKDLRSILSKMKDSLNSIEQEKANSFIKKVDSLLQFYNHLSRQDSVIIKAMIEGSWLLLDGIENAPSDFFDRLFTLFDDNPLLNLYERGNGYIYSYDSNNPERRIHPDFRIIMTYNPNDSGIINSFSTSLLSRCAIYSMKAIDNDVTDSSLIIFGLINQFDFTDMKQDPSELSIKLGKIQMVSKDFTFNNQFSVTGRSIIHLCRNIEYISTVENIDFRKMESIINSIYGSLMNDPMKFIKAVNEIFAQNVEIDMLENIKKAQLITSKAYIEIMNLINNFMNEIKENIQYKFDFEAFLGWLLQLHLRDVEMVYNTMSYKLIEFLTQLIKDVLKNSEITDSVIDFVSHCSSIKCLQILIDEFHQACQYNIENKFAKNSTLNSPQVREIPQFQIILKKVRCLLFLIQKNLFTMRSFPIFFSDTSRRLYLDVYENMESNYISNFVKDDFVKLFIREDDELLDVVNRINNDLNPPCNYATLNFIISFLFFNDTNCKFLFDGINEKYFVFLYTILNDNSDIEIFMNSIDFIESFYQFFSFNYDCTLDGFIELCKDKLTTDIDKLHSNFQVLRTINNKLSFLNDQSETDAFTIIKPIVGAVIDLYHQTNEQYSNLYLKKHKNQEIAKEFYKLIDTINDRLEREKELKLPLELFAKLAYEIEINTENYDFLKQIYLSIKVQKDKQISKFTWPHGREIRFSSETPSFPLLNSLINYSKKEQIDFQSTNWMTLCSIEENTEYFLKEFLNKSISPELIAKYKTNNKANLLYELSQIQDGDNIKYKYCSRNEIITFFNKISDRSSKVNQDFIDLAHYYELNMDKNFIIDIPNFEINDIIALLINPIDQSPGPLFKDLNFTEHDITEHDIEFIKLQNNEFELTNNIEKDVFLRLTRDYLLTKKSVKKQVPNINNLTLKAIVNKITSTNSIKIHIQNMVQTIYKAYQISQIALSKKKQIDLTFDDIPYKFNEEFINKHPVAGFYITLYQEVRPVIEQIKVLCNNSSFPISVFIFRQFTNENIIEIKLPSSFSSGLSQDVESFIIHISDIVKSNINKGTITKFCNLLGFLLDSVPITLDSHHTEHFREIILDLMSKVQSPIISKYIMKYLHNEIEKMILVLGSDKWDQLLTSNCIKPSDPFLMFLMNPWEEVFQSILKDFEKDKKECDEKIRKILDLIHAQFIRKYTSGFYNKILDAKYKDERDLQIKIKEEYIRNNLQMKENSENPESKKLQKTLNSYCQYLNKELDQIKVFPEVTNGKFNTKDFYTDFHQFLVDNKGFSHPTLDKELILIVIIPKGKKEATVKLTYNDKNQVTVVTGLVTKIAIFKMPPNTSIEKLNLQSNDATIMYDTVFTNSSVGICKKFKYNEMKEYFNNYQKSLNQFFENDEDVKIGNIEVKFNTHTYDNFIEKIKEVSNEISKNISEAGSLNELAKLAETILSKFKSLKDYFPVKFENQTEIPKETISCLEQFSEFLNKSELSLKEIEIPKEIIDADEEFVINKDSVFQRILSTVKRFAKNPKPSINGETTLYEEKEFQISCKNPEKLIIPTLFYNGNDIYLNINSLTAKFGPFYKGTPYSDLKFRIINLTKQEIKCIFHQDNEIIDLQFENVEGFFYLVFPISKIEFDYNEDSEIVFTGKISFYSNDSEEPFKEISYDVSLMFLSPNIYLKLEKQSFAIKDGEAQILPYYAISNSNINIRAIPYFKQLKMFELSDNTAKKPRINVSNEAPNDIRISLPFKNFEEDHLSIQLDFGLTADTPVPIPCNIDLSDPYFNVLMFDDDYKDFNLYPNVTVGNLWREVYILISYINLSDKPISPIITFEKMNSEYFEIRLNKPIVFEPFSQKVQITSFKVRTFGKAKRENIKNILKVKIGISKPKEIQFYLYLDSIFINNHTEKISSNFYLPNCSYWDGKQFSDYITGRLYENQETNYILSSVSYNYYYQKDNTDFLSLKYNDFGVLTNVYNRKDYEFEALCIENGKPELKVVKHFHQSKSDELVLFARVKGKQEMFFPLFGYCKSASEMLDVPNIEKTNANLKIFYDWYFKFLTEGDKNYPSFMIGIDNKFVSVDQQLYSDNISYLFKYLIRNYQKLQYIQIVKEIKQFTNSNYIEEKYFSVINQSITLEWKVISLIWAIMDTMIIRYEDLRICNFILNFPIPLEAIKNEQKKLIKKARIDSSYMLTTYGYDKQLCEMNKINSINDNHKNKFKKDGYKVSKFVKWTFEKNFQPISEQEFPKEDTHDKTFDDFVKTEFSNESGNIELSNVSFKNVNNLLGIYKAFDSILKNTYQLTISIHSSIAKKKGLKQNIEILNELVSFFMWANNIKDHSPYSTYIDRFIMAYQSMIMRLQSSGLKIRDNHYLKTNNQNNDFVVMPKYNINFETFIWSQPGKKKKEIVQKKVDDESKKNPEEETPQKPIVKKPKPKKNTDKKNGSFISKGEGKGGTGYDVVPDKKVDIVQYSKDLVEIPNYDYIDYILSTMKNPDEEKQEIKVFYDDKTHIPVHYNATIKEKSMEKVNYFFYAAETLSASILNGLGVNSPLLNNIDNCYASILIDCSNTFSNIQKASLILLSIAYANSLAAFRIPYSIILFCDDNFQYILKKLDDKHDKVHFLRLIESMTVNRRMSSMSDAIQMAKMKIVPTGINSKRTNHIIYTLSDGLSASLNFVKEWREKVLENKNVSVSFFFLNILSGEESHSIIDIWSKFATGISKAKSSTTVYYSKYDDILNNKDFFNILSKPNESDVTQLVSLSECFANPIIQSVSQSDKKYSHLITMKKLPKKKQTIEFNTEMFEQIERFLFGKSSTDTKYFKDNSYDNSIDDPFDIEIPQLRIDPFSANITKSDSADSRENYSRFCNDLFELSSTIVDQSSAQELSSYVFVPNKPSQYTPSSDGTLFYFPGLIRFLLTQGQDTKIFLEKKAGLTKSYSIFVVIDCSTSCFNIESSIHAFQSIFILLETLSKIDIPAFNLIVTSKKGAHVLCLEKSTFDALSVYSPVWVSLFTYLLNPHEDCFLKSALLTALSIRTQEKTLSSVLFLFTDGNFSDHNLKVYNSLLDNISSYNVETITIGIGSYPSNISSLLFKKVWSANPKNVVKAILSAFGKESNDLIPNISSLHEIVAYKDEEESKSFGLILAKKLEFESFDDYSFKELITELNRVTRNISVFNDFYNIKSNGNEIFSEDKSHDLGKKNFYKGISILICQFWDYTMSSNEDKNVSKEVLINGIDEKKLSVINSLKEFGIETVIVQNYHDAINRLKEGEFSEVWIICGRYDGEMPDKTKYSNLLSQFIDCLIKYWENGGGIVFWTDNSPLVAEVNFFLSKAKFEKQKTNKKDAVEFDTVNFRIGGSYPGCQMLVKCEKARNASFNSHEKIKCDGYEKYLYNANMTQIYEGFTISSAIKLPKEAEDQCYQETEKYEFATPPDFYPFHAFSKSSSGGISSLYYNAPLESPKGDIVIDCGSSKLFFELTKEGIYWYVRNIAIFMLSLEKKSSMIGGKADPREFKPKKFDFDIKPYVKPDPKFYTYNAKRAVDIVFMIDGTGSMKYLINAVIDVCNDLAIKCKANSAENDFKFGAVIYRDEAIGNIYRETTKNDNHKVYKYNNTEFLNLNSNIQKLKEFLQEIKPQGGGNDGPEDWVSGYQRLRKLSWRSYSEKIVIHIADAPAHGKPFHNGNHEYPRFTNDEKYNHKLYDDMDIKQNREIKELIKWAAQYKIRFSCICNDNYQTINSFKKAKSIYQKNNGIDFNYIVLNNYNSNNDTISDKQKQLILDKIKDVALKSIDKCVAVDNYKPLPKPEPEPLKPLLPTIPRQKPKPKPKEPDVHIEFKPAVKFTSNISFADLIAKQEERSKNLGNQTYSPPIEKTKSAPIKKSPYSFLNIENETDYQNSTNNNTDNQNENSEKNEEDENDQNVDSNSEENENEEDLNSSGINDDDDDANNFNFNENDDDDDDDVDNNSEIFVEDDESDSSYDDNGAEFEEF